MCVIISICVSCGWFRILCRFLSSSKSRKRCEINMSYANLLTSTSRASSCVSSTEHRANRWDGLSGLTRVHLFLSRITAYLLSLNARWCASLFNRSAAAQYDLLLLCFASSKGRFLLWIFFKRFKGNSGSLVTFAIALCQLSSIASKRRHRVFELPILTECIQRCLVTEALRCRFRSKSATHSPAAAAFLRDVWA